MSEKMKHGIDYYIEGERVIITALAHIKRGSCCGNGCKNCAYEPKMKREMWFWQKSSLNL
jgi:hypothetical protein